MHERYLLPLAPKTPATKSKSLSHTQSNYSFRTKGGYIGRLLKNANKTLMSVLLMLILFMYSRKRK